MNDQEKDLFVDKAELKPLTNFVADIQKWILSLESDADITTLENAYMKLLYHLGNHRTNLQRHLLTRHINNKDIAKYDDHVKQIAVITGETKKDITELKQKLIEAQNVRENKIEYDKIAPEIVELSSRDECQEMIRKLEEEIATLESIKNEKEQGLISRQRAAEVSHTFLEEERERDVQRRETLRKIDPNYAASDDEEEGIVRDGDGDGEGEGEGDAEAGSI